MKYISVKEDARPDNALVALAQRGDTEAQNILVMRHIGFIRMVVGRMMGRENVEEWIADGVAGFCKGIQRFKKNKGVKLLTYSAWWVMRGLNDSRRDQCFMAVPYNVICSNANREKHREVLDRARFPSSLSAPARDRHGDKFEREWADTPLPKPVEVDGELIRRLVSELPERIRGVVTDRMAGLSLAQIGERLNLSRQRVQQLEADGHKMLRMSIARESAAVP